MDSASAEAMRWFEHGERSMPAAQTVARLRPHFAELGITRLARQTGLDRIGIPCFSAIRPAGLTLSVTQGKGPDDASAMASALMEAAEYAIAERPRCPVRTATAAELEGEDSRVFNPRRLLPPDARLSPQLPIRWVAGQVWPAGERIWLPFDALSLDGDPGDLPEISQSSNGLASGNTVEEALFHALCELLERDATTLWSLLPDAARQATEFSPGVVGDAAVQRMSEQIAGAGLELRLFDQSTDLGVPCVMAVIRDAGTGVSRRFDASAGYGCHPVGRRAVTRAITEAAQTRITNIAGARDDFLPSEYFEHADDSTGFLAAAPVQAGHAPEWLEGQPPVPDLLVALGERLGGIVDLAWAELGGAGCGIAVVRVVSTLLEDRESNANWRPGARALRMLRGS